MDGGVRMFFNRKKEDLPSVGKILVYCVVIVAVLALIGWLFG